MSISNSFKDLAGGGLDDFAPKPARPAEQTPQTAAPSSAPAPSPQEIERIAAAEGFALDNFPVARKALRSGRVASRDKAQPMTLRLRVADWNRFSAFCERNGYTVADGFGRLLESADTQ